jgi:hypothetical protein
VAVEVLADGTGGSSGTGTKFGSTTGLLGPAGTAFLTAAFFFFYDAHRHRSRNHPQTLDRAIWSVPGTWTRGQRG